MKKRTVVAGSVVVVAVIYLGATWYIGKRTQEFTEQAVVQANERMTGVLGSEAERSGTRLELSSYQRGFFSSVVQYSLHMKDAEGKPAEIRFLDHVQHGPFPWGALKAGHFAPLLAHNNTSLVPTPFTQAWVDSQDGASPLEGHTDVAMSGNGTSVWVFKPTKIAAKDGSQIDFSGGRLKVDFSNNFRDSEATGGFERFSLEGDGSGGKVEVRDIDIGSTTHVGADDNTRSQSKATIGAIDVSRSGTDERFSFENVVVNLDSTQEGTLADTELRYDFGKMLVGDTNLGSLALGGRVTGLDIKALVALGNEYDAIVARHGGKQGDDIDLTPSEQKVLEAKAMDILASNPAVVIDPVVWKNDKGETTARLALDLTQPAQTEAPQPGVLVPEYVKKMQLALGVSRDMLVELFGQMRQEASERKELEMMGGLLYDQYVSRLQQAGLVMVDAGRASTDIVYEGNTVTVNGETMSVQDFLMRAMMLMM